MNHIDSFTDRILEVVDGSLVTSSGSETSRELPAKPILRTRQDASLPDSIAHNLYSAQVLIGHSQFQDALGFPCKLCMRPLSEHSHEGMKCPSVTSNGPLYQEQSYTGPCEFEYAEGFDPADSVLCGRDGKWVEHLQGTFCAYHQKNPPQW